MDDKESEAPSEYIKKVKPLTESLLMDIAANSARVNAIRFINDRKEFSYLDMYKNLGLSQKATDMVIKYFMRLQMIDSIENNRYQITDILRVILKYVNPNDFDRLRKGENISSISEKVDGLVKIHSLACFIADEYSKERWNLENR